MISDALLFDLDGTLIETDRLHHEAFSDMLAEYGRGIGWEEYTAQVMGRPNADIMADMFPDRPDEHKALADRKEAMFRGRLAASVDPVPGLVDLLDWADDRGVAVAVVTNAPRVNAEAMLAAAGLKARLTTLIIGEECVRSKPDPLPYVTAMRALGVTPSRSTAFEDSRAGLRAARASGAHVFGMTTGLDAAELLRSGAHQAIADFTDPALWAHLDSLKARTA
jgi:beta-phosphoglucomutase